MANVLNSKEFNIWEENETVFLLFIDTFTETVYFYNTNPDTFIPMLKRLKGWQTDIKSEPPTWIDSFKTVTYSVYDNPLNIYLLLLSTAAY